MIFLDTHVVAWLYEGLLTKIPKSTQKILEDNELYISPMVELELDFLYEIKRLKKNGPTIVRDLDAHMGLNISRIDFYRLIEQAQQLRWTRDPFDRLIVANAMIFQAPLVSKDNTILQHYPLAHWDN